MLHSTQNVKSITDLIKRELHKCVLFLFQLIWPAYSAYSDHFTRVSELKMSGFRKLTVTNVRIRLPDIRCRLRQHGGTNIEPAGVALIIQQCNAFTKPVRVNPNLPPPIEAFPEIVARQL